MNDKGLIERTKEDACRDDGIACRPVGAHLYTAFDVMGRVTASNQITNGHTYTFPNYDYNLAGVLQSETYPSGRVVTTEYDGANRPLTVKGKWNGNTTPYVSDLSYWPHGAMRIMSRGNGLSSVVAGYNSRLQPVETYEARNNLPDQFLHLTCLDWGTPDASNGSNPCSTSFPNSSDNGTLHHKIDFAGGPSPLASLTAYQTPAGQSVNIFTFGGGTQTLTSAWGSLTSAQAGAGRSYRSGKAGRACL